MEECASNPKLEGCTMAKRSVSFVRSGSTGPRTLAGKARSKFNALKHGVLSSAVVLDSESEQEYARFVSELANVLGPVGKLEETLVEKIATTMWRHRRLLRAEAAGISCAGLLAEKTFADRMNDRRLANALYKDDWPIQKAILSHDTMGLFGAIRLFKQLRQRILDDGLDWDRDRMDFEEIFGKALVDEAEASRSETGRARHASLPVLYREHLGAREGQPRGPKSEASQSMVEQLTEQIDFLEPIALTEADRGKKFDRFRADKSLVPEEKDCERIIRYEAHLDRTLDRALTQLERFQRMSLGQPVFPAIKVDLTK
jgi:hypothetical protein